MTKVRAETRSRNQGRRKNHVFNVSAKLPTLEYSMRITLQSLDQMQQHYAAGLTPVFLEKVNGAPNGP